MCLATIGEVISIDGDNATVDFGGVRYEINTSLVKARIGDRVLVHAGFAIQIMGDEDARSA